MANRYSAAASGAGAASGRDFGDDLASAFGFGSFDERTLTPEMQQAYSAYLNDLQSFGYRNDAVDEQKAFDAAGFAQDRARAEQAYGRQGSALDLAEQAALGKVPSVAELQGRKQLDQSLQQNIGLARSGGGAAGMRAALYANAKAGQAGAGDAAMMRAQEMANARGQYMQGTQGMSSAAAQMRGQGQQQAQMALQNQQANKERAFNREAGAMTGIGTTLGNLASIRSGDLNREAGFEGAQAPMAASTIGGVMKSGGALIDKIPSDPLAKMNILGAGDALAGATQGRQDQGMILQGAASQLGASNPMSDPNSYGGRGPSFTGTESPFQSSIDQLNQSPSVPRGNVLGFTYSAIDAKQAVEPASFLGKLTSAIDAKSGLVPAGMHAPWGGKATPSLGGPLEIKTDVTPAGLRSPAQRGAPINYTTRNWLAPQGAPTEAPGVDPNAPPPAELLAAMRMPMKNLGEQREAEEAGQAAIAQSNANIDALIAKNQGRFANQGDDNAAMYDRALAPFNQQQAAKSYVWDAPEKDAATPGDNKGTAPKEEAKDSKDKGKKPNALEVYGDYVAKSTQPYTFSTTPLVLQSYQLGKPSDPRAKGDVSSDASPIRDFEEKAKGFTYQYKSPEFEDGTYAPGTRHMGPMADALKEVKGGIGDTLTYEDPKTGLLGVNTGRLTLANAAAVNDLHERIKRLEGGKTKKGRG